MLKKQKNKMLRHIRLRFANHS
ncbi:rCG48895 [Rattus norvegicus]|uniref:RCG48895 n=1 Tax=Rattus norvegicus TaxID=10116 RepID=A6IG85_RAT|nr:rCG48895 [Rattus norvegicus]